MDILSSLQMVPINRLHLHEGHEPHRLEETARAIEAEGVLCHPPLAYRMAGGDYLILDGAHRTGSLGLLGCRHVPVQVVRRDQFCWEAWDHVVERGPWLKDLLQDPALHPVEGEDPGNDATLCVVDEEGRHLRIEPAEGSSRLEVWHRVVRAYRDIPVRRCPPDPDSIPPAGFVLIRHPQPSTRFLEQTVKRGGVLPAGVTRCLVEGRLLNLRIPLQLLHAPTVDKQEWEHLKHRWAGRMRHYTESVYLCEA
ncbi:ParB N-terminal domain-containing protein [Salinithrix halophila]|uniref:ParB N-terminal domain-containing protein n=1 Tax=Salinithrix halophila TaxID=1485204 RepID=A0ABV8J9T9_9BACL